MDMKEAAAALAALGLENRLEIVLLLVRKGRAGMRVGEIVVALGAKQNSVSGQLKILPAAGIIVGERDGREIVYRAAPEPRIGQPRCSSVMPKPSG
jgi:DNA-binding transcriptional ArsR family regulator